MGRLSAIFASSRIVWLLTSIVGLVAVLLQYRPSQLTNSFSWYRYNWLKCGESKSSGDQAILNFIQWFQDNGGWIHPNISLRTFADYGGKGLFYDTSGSFLTVGDDYDTEIDYVEEGEAILVIPELLILSRRKALNLILDCVDDYSSTTSNEKSTLDESLDDLELMTLALVFESSCSCRGDGRRSGGDGQMPSNSYAPYLDILPKPNDTPNLLYTFRDEELELLRDKHLLTTAHHTKDRLLFVWKQILSMERIISTCFIDQTEVSLTHSQSHQKLWQAFRHYYAVVSSHAMFLDGMYMLVPMADMINHQPRLRPKSNHTEPADNSPTNSKSFAHYHYWQERQLENKVLAKEMVVLADRRIPSGSQVLEEYSTLDNSLYLVSFGFVPVDNPYHCVELLLVVPLKSNDLRVLLQGIVGDALTMCVRRDLTILDGQEHALDLALSLVSLDKLEDSTRKGACTQELQLHMKHLLTMNTNGVDLGPCQDILRLTGGTRDSTVWQIMHDMICASAAAAVETSRSFLANDKHLLTQRNATEREILALQFRIEDVKLLEQLVKTCDGA